MELLCVFAAILKRNPELIFTGELSCDRLIQEAVAMFKKARENRTALGASIRRQAHIENVANLGLCPINTTTLIICKCFFSFQDQEIPCDEMSVFYNSPVLTTSGYLARAVVNNVLKESSKQRSVVHHSPLAGSIFENTDC